MRLFELLGIHRTTNSATPSVESSKPPTQQDSKESPAIALSSISAQAVRLMEKERLTRFESLAAAQSGFSIHRTLRDLHWKLKPIHPSDKVLHNDRAMLYLNRATLGLLTLKKPAEAHREQEVTQDFQQAIEALRDPLPGKPYELELKDALAHTSYEDRSLHLATLAHRILNERFPLLKMLTIEAGKHKLPIIQPLLG